LKLEPKSSSGDYLLQVYAAMLDHFGPQRWWPAESPLEMMVGAILTQNTNWVNVEKAIKNLKKENALSTRRLHEMSKETLAALIRPAGYFNIKAGRLKNLIGHIIKEYEGDVHRLLGEDIPTLRSGLLGVKGVGPETADSIVLYAAHKPVFVVDAYTYRILNRHDIVDEARSYEELQDYFMDTLPEDVLLFQEFHALIVKTGKEYCKSKPVCDVCPLKKFFEK
jgi:endonuclease-3 related protein